ncbi:hypothetical protein V8F06_014221 [Rhypophila decipiens]
MSRENCMIFINSDVWVWIEAQKSAVSGNSHVPKLENSDRNPCFKVDIGNLVEGFREDRTQGPSFIYRSCPPPHDSVWETFKKNQFETNIYNRDLKDNSMSADISKKATELKILRT